MINPAPWNTFAASSSSSSSSSNSSSSSGSGGTGGGSSSSSSISGSRHVNFPIFAQIFLKIFKSGGENPRIPNRHLTVSGQLRAPSVSLCDRLVVMKVNGNEIRLEQPE
jgi:hypothetical protein